MADFKPYADDAAALTIGDFTAENGTDNIAVHGDVDLTRDKVGLDKARKLKALLTDIVAALEGQSDLPDKIDLPKVTITKVKNPFA